MDFLFPHGFKYPPDFHIPTPTGEELFRIGPVGYTNAHLTMAIVIVLLAGISFLATRNMRERPAGLQNAVELLAQGLADFVASIGGQNALKYLPLFGTLFLFIVTSNWLSVVPLIGQVKFLLSGFKDGPAIGVIFVLVGFIELFSELFRMLTLTLRLWGNVFGGEIMLVVMSGLLLLPGLALPFVGLEVFIGLVQGLVFALLVLMYFILAIESHDEEHEEGSQADTDRVPSPEMHPRPAAST
ncbi:MAG: F0F1 ATP synthase subunit A [Chloroflexi bacterium]|nr:MAG: F0F1 ATP synthase subunit A [Chloroflexota bacterium]